MKIGNHILGNFRLEGE